LRRRLLRGAGAFLLAALLASVLAVASLRWLDPPASAFMLQRALAAWRAGEDRPWVHHRWAAWPEIAPAMRLAAVAAEDQRFPEHWGFDVDAIRNALAEYRAGGRLRGASTISQQVAKNLFLWPGRSWLRKGLEAYFTVLIELLWRKRRILEIYLNVAEFGQGVYGVGAASERFFGIPPSALGPVEASRLAAVLPNPDALDAAAPGPRVLERAAWIRAQMRALGPGYLSGL